MRIKFQDEQTKQGEMELRQVKAGDLVRFLADFRKLAGPNGVVDVRKDEIGEVIATAPESLRVRVPATRTAAGDAFSEDAELDLEPSKVAVLVDSRDPRIGDNRITAAAPQLVEVDPIGDDTLMEYLQMEAESMGCEAPWNIPPELRAAADEWARMFNGVLNYWLAAGKWPPPGNPGASSAYQFDMGAGPEMLFQDQMEAAAHFAFMDMRGEGTGLWDTWEHLFPKEMIADLQNTLRTHPGSRKAFERFETALQNALMCEDEDDGGEDDEGGELERPIERAMPVQQAPRMQLQPQQMTAALEPWELEVFVQEVAARGVNPLRQGHVVAALACGRFSGVGLHRRAAALVASASPAAWRAFVLDAGLAPPQLLRADVVEFLDQFGWYAPEAYELAEWAISAASFGPSSERVRTLDISRRADVLAALDELIADVRGGPYTTQQSLQPMEEGYEYVENVVPGQPPKHEPDVAEHVDATAGELTKAREFVASQDDARWAEFVGIMQQRKQRPAPAPVTPVVEDHPSPMVEPPVSGPAPSLELAPEMGLGGEEEEEDPAGLRAPAAADPSILLPIGLPPGQGRQRIYAEPGMRVFCKSKGYEGDVIGGSTTVTDGIVVDVEGRQEVWDAMDVAVSTKWRGSKRAVPFDEIERWKKQRRDRMRGQSGHVACYEVTHGRSVSIDRSAPDVHRADRAHGESGAHPAGGSGQRGADRGRGSRTEPPPPADTRAARLGAGFLLDDGPSAFVGWGDELELLHRTALAPLGVKELKRWMNGPGEFAVISAYKVRPKSQNQKAHGDLMAELQRRGYSPSQIRPLRGQYFDVSQREDEQRGQMKAEQSYLILGMPFREAMEIARAFGQESFIYKSPEGVVGSYYSDGSGRANLALAGDDLAIGDQGTQIRERAPKPVPGGPPAPSDPWSKARGVGFEFPINWGREFKHDPSRPLTPDEARQQLGLTEVGAEMLS